MKKIVLKTGSLCAVLFAASIGATAQLKIGANPTQIQAGAKLQIDGTTGLGTQSFIVTNQLDNTNTATTQPGVGIGGTGVYSALHIANGLANPKMITLYQDQPGDNRWYGMGISSGTLRYMTTAPLRNPTSHTFYAGNTDLSSAPIELMRISTAEVTVGTTDNSRNLRVYGSAFKNDGSTAWTTFSDGRLKKDVHPFTDGLKQVMQIEPVFFKYNGKAGIVSTSEEDQVGIIAQDMQRIAPYTVKETDIKVDESNHGALQFTKADAIMYMLVNAVKEQQKQIQELKAEVEQLKQNAKSAQFLTTSVDVKEAAEKKK